MQAFIIETANRPGEFARQASAIAQRDINVAAICLGLGSRGGSAFLARDESGVRSALTGAGLEYHEVPVVTVWLDDRPGTGDFPRDCCRPEPPSSSVVSVDSASR